jgi:hypothetical protein
MKSVIIIGVVLALLGLIVTAQPVFTTSHTKDVAKLGDLNIQTKEQTQHVIPPVVGEGVFVLGLIVIGAGVLVRR